MRRFILIALCVLPQGQRVYADVPACMLQAEYRYDSVDFEDTASHYLRVKSTLGFSRDSAFNAAVVYRENDQGSVLHTWNLSLHDMSPYVSFTAGHYYVHAGAGLFMGQKSAYNFDAFAPKTRRMDAEPIAPAVSGNPACAFYGVVMGIDSGPENTDVSSRTFYSVNTRYINEDDYYAGSTDAGLNSIFGSVNKTHARFEPVMIETYGTLVILPVAGNLRLSAYAARAGINRPAGGHIGVMKIPGPAGNSWLRDTTGAGMHMHYADRVLACFLETALTWKGIRSPQDGRESVRGSGIIGGITLNYPAFFLSFTGKYTGPGYYAPFASSTGEERPERAWFAASEYRPSSYLALGAQVSDEKYLSPSSPGMAEPGSAMRSTCHVRCSYGALRSAKLAFRVLDKNGSNTSYDKRQLGLASEWRITDSLDIDTACIRQTARGSEAYYVSAGAGHKLLGLCLVSFQYGRAWASSGNAVYASALPLPHSGISVIALREGCHAMAARYALKHPSFSTHVRYFLQIAGTRILDQRMECCATGRW